MARNRGEKTAIGFMIVWLIFWMAGMIVVLYGFARAILGGDGVAGAFMALWLAAAAFGLWSGTRKLRQLLTTTPRADASQHIWHDALPRHPER